VIGAVKAGTTSLHDYLRQHPEVFMPQRKELMFFAYNGTGGDAIYPAKTLEQYEGFFDPVTDETAIGEASPRYLASERAAERIREIIPAARLIVSLRNPVDRAFSAYQMDLRAGRLAGMPFIETLETTPRRWYSQSLQSYFSRFDRSQFRIILFEDLVRQPVATVQSLFAFLGVAPDFEPEIEIANPGGLPRNKRLHRLLDNKWLKRLGRKYAPEALADLGKSVRSRNLQKQRMTEDERARALAIFRDDILATQELIGRDLSAWLRT
jgi:hypothetical protein